jgi:hypothetical protein
MREGPCNPGPTSTPASTGADADMSAARNRPRPAGKRDRGLLLAAMARRRIGWVELFAKPILFGKRSLMGIASAFASRELRRDKLGFGGQVAPPIL